MTLIPNWQAVHKRLSWQLKALAAFLLTLPDIITHAWAVLPPDLRAMVPYADKLAVVTLLASLVASYVERKPHV